MNETERMAKTKFPSECYPGMLMARWGYPVDFTHKPEVWNAATCAPAATLLQQFAMAMNAGAITVEKGFYILTPEGERAFPLPI